MASWGGGLPGMWESSHLSWSIEEAEEVERIAAAPDLFDCEMDERIEGRESGWTFGVLGFSGLTLRRMLETAVANRTEQLGLQ